jgi:antitoxin PrlF
VSAATISSKGQITIPKQIRDGMGLRRGDQVVFVLEEGRIFLYPVQSKGFEPLRGVWGGRAINPGKEIEREAARTHVVERVLTRSRD